MTCWCHTNVSYQRVIPTSLEYPNVFLCAYTKTKKCLLLPEVKSKLSFHCVCLPCQTQTVFSSVPRSHHLSFFLPHFPPEMAQKVPAYSICWNKRELQKEYFFLEGKCWGLVQCLASKTCKQLASFHKQTVHLKRLCSFLSIQAEKPKCLGV